MLLCEHITDLIVKVYFQNEHKDLDFDFAYSAFPYFEKQILNKEYFYIAILDNDIFATEPLRILLDNIFRPLKMSTTENEGKDNTSFMPDGIIIGFHKKDKFAKIEIRIVELKSRPTPKEGTSYDGDVCILGYLEQINKFCNVFSLKNLDYDMQNRDFTFYNGTSVNVSDSLEMISEIRLQNTSTKYSVLVAEYTSKLMESNNELYYILQNRFNTSNLGEIKLELERELFNRFSNNDDLSYTLIIDNPTGIDITKLKESISFHGFIPEISSIERFYTKGADSFTYEFKLL